MSSPSARGFTILETVTAVSILGVLACLAVPGLLRHLCFVRLENAAQVLRSDMMRARYLAVSRNCYYRLRFDPPRQRYAVEEDFDANGRQDRGERTFPPTPLPEQVRFDAEGVLGPPSSPNRAPASPVTFTKNCLTVGPDGCWCSPGTVYLGNPEGDHVALSVAMAGRIRIWVWDEETLRWD